MPIIPPAVAAPFVARPRLPLNRRVAVVGDSRSANNLSMALPSITRRVAGWQTWLGILSGARCEFVPGYNFATAGYRTDQVLPYAQAAAATDASIVIVFAGTNDRSGGYGWDWTLSYLSQIRDRLLAAGKIVVFVAETPRGGSSGSRLSGQQLAWHLRTHQWLLDQDRAFADVYTADPWPALALVGSASGDCIDAYFQDSIHPNPEGGFRIAQALQPIIERLLPLPSFLSTSNADAWSTDNPGGNLVSNPTMSGTSGAKVGTATGTVATALQAGGSTGAAPVFDIYTDPNDGTPWQRLTLGGTPSVSTPAANAVWSIPAANVSNGDVLQGAIEIAVDTPLANAVSIEVTVAATVAGTFVAGKECSTSGVAADRVPAKTFSGVFRTPKLVIPANGAITSPSFYISVGLVNGAAASGVVRFRRPTVRKVSA